MLPVQRLTSCLRRQGGMLKVATGSDFATGLSRSSYKPMQYA